MPLVDLSTSTPFTDYYNKGTGVFLMIHPITGERFCRIDGENIRPPWGTKAHLQTEVRVHYVRHKEMSQARHRADILIRSIGLTVTDKLALVGAGFGWLQEVLEEQLPGIQCVCVETSPYIQGAKDSNEFVELDAAVQKAGFLPVEAMYAEAMNYLSDGIKARRTLNDEDVSSASARNRVEGKLASGKFTWAISEHVLEWLDDVEAVDLDSAMRKMAPNVCHMVREYSPRQASITEPGTLSNWKWFENVNDGVKQELLDQPWYTVDNWQDLLNANSVLVRV